MEQETNTDLVELQETVASPASNESQPKDELSLAILSLIQRLRNNDPLEKTD